MKIEQAGTQFQPVVITLESQEEVDILFELAGCVAGSGIVRVLVNQLWTKLQESASDPDECKYFDSDAIVTCETFKI